MQSFLANGCDSHHYHRYKLATLRFSVTAFSVSSYSSHQIRI